MPSLSEHKASQANESEAWAADAEKIGKKVLSASTVEAARRAVVAVTDTTSRTALDEAVADIGDLRASPSLASSLDDDMVASQEAVLEIMLEAMEEGLDSEMRWQTTQVDGLKWELTDEDSMQLAGYPIQGHTAAEISTYMHTQLRYEVAGITASPLDGSTDVSTVPSQLLALVDRFSGRCANAVREAYYAGVQLGVRMTAEAIANAG